MRSLWINEGLRAKSGSRREQLRTLYLLMPMPCKQCNRGHRLDWTKLRDLCKTLTQWWKKPWKLRQWFRDVQFLEISPCIVKIAAENYTSEQNQKIKKQRVRTFVVCLFCFLNRWKPYALLDGDVRWKPTPYLAYITNTKQNKNRARFFIVCGTERAPLSCGTNFTPKLPVSRLAKSRTKT